MEQIDQSQRVDMYAPKSSSRILRWMIWIMLVIAGSMIVIVLLSHPRAAPYVQSGLVRFESLMASFETDKSQSTVDLAAPIEITDVSPLDPVSETETAAQEKPEVLSMPTSHIPVNRLGLGGED